VQRWFASLFRFPGAADDLPLSLRFECRNGVERWTRQFGAERLSSTLMAGHARSSQLLCERFGPFDFAQATTRAGWSRRHNESHADDEGPQGEQRFGNQMDPADIGDVR
jgi:hypothetical protein